MEITEIENINEIVSHQLAEYDDEYIHAEQHRFVCSEPSAVRINGPTIVTIENGDYIVYQPFITIRFKITRPGNVIEKLLSLYSDNFVLSKDSARIVDLMSIFVKKWKSVFQMTQSEEFSEHEISRDSTTDE